MTKIIITSTLKGKFAFLFLIVGVVGVVFQFIFLYLPLIKAGLGDVTIIADFVFYILALTCCVLAVILSIYIVPRNLWIILVLSTTVLILIPPIIYAAVNHLFPYVTSDVLQVPYYFAAPTNPLLDFIGFWMAVGGTLIAAVIGFTLPKN